jgi:hypothetical protein
MDLRQPPRPTTPMMEDDNVDVSGAKLPRPFLLHRFGRYRVQRPDPRDPCRWGQLDFWPQPGPSKGRGRQHLCESAHAHFCQIVSIFASLMHTQSYVEPWVCAQRSAGGHLAFGCGEVRGHPYRQGQAAGTEVEEVALECRPGYCEGAEGGNSLRA